MFCFCVRVLNEASRIQYKPRSGLHAMAAGNAAYLYLTTRIVSCLHVAQVKVRLS